MLYALIIIVDMQNTWRARLCKPHRIHVQKLEVARTLVGYTGSRILTKMQDDTDTELIILRQSGPLETPEVS